MRKNRSRHASGIDNTVATYGAPCCISVSKMKPSMGAPANITLGQPLEMVIGVTGKESLTADTVARVRASWQQYPDRYESLFDQIGQLTNVGQGALQEGRLDELGELMNLCHGYLNALQLSRRNWRSWSYCPPKRGHWRQAYGWRWRRFHDRPVPRRHQFSTTGIEAAGYKAIPITLNSATRSF